MARSTDENNEPKEPPPKVIDLALESSVPEDSYFEAPVPRSNDALEALDVDRLRDLYDRGDILAFRLTTVVRPRTQRPRLKISSIFRLFIRRDDDIQEGLDYFVRGHLRIPERGYIRRYKARTLTLVDSDSHIGHLLRDAEGPAHAEWNRNSQRLKDSWIGGSSRVHEVRQASTRILRVIVERPNTKQVDALADLFPGRPDAAADVAHKVTFAGTRIGIRPGIPPSSNPPLQIDRRHDSVIVRTRRSAEVPVNTRWDLRFAYDVVRGNPFSQFESGLRQGCVDFSFHEHLKHASEGCYTYRVI